MAPSDAESLSQQAFSPRQSRSVGFPADNRIAQTYVLQMDEQDVAAWLHSIGMSRYAQVFQV
jgi:hypothetical protein